MKEIERQLKEFREQDENKSNWVQDLVRKYYEISKKFNDASIDLESERSHKRELHKETAKWQRIYEDLQNSVDRSSFVVILIDADTDGYVFNEKYLLRGTQGGHQAAHDLKVALQEYFAKDCPAVSGLPCMIKLYANVEKLKVAMLRSGMNEAAGQLLDFTRGFSQVGGLVDFIDIGDGREQADHQIKGVLEHFKENPSCKHIMLGGCHDNGYVRNLNIIAPNERIRDRITLLKSFQTGAEYDSLPFKSTRFQTLFRDRPLSAPSQSPIVKDAGGHASENGAVNIIPSNSYATMANGKPGASSVQTNRNSSDPSGLFVSGQVLLNFDGQRIDTNLVQASSAGRDSLNRKKKTLGKNPCNMHHLSNKCLLQAPQCSFFHETLTGAEMLVVRNDLRRQPCKKGLECRDPLCFYGHNCKCKNNACKFRKDMHDVELRGVRTS